MIELTYAEIRAEDTRLDDPDNICCTMGCDKKAEWRVLWQEKGVPAYDSFTDSCSKHLGEALESEGFLAYLVYRLGEQEGVTAPTRPEGMIDTDEE